MNLLSIFNRSRTAPLARERLQVLLAHERVASSGQFDLIALLREEVLEVIARHVPIDRDKVQVKMERGDGVSMIEIDVEIPNGHGVMRKAVGA
jgi:cell division topological specificity factor